MSHIPSVFASYMSHTFKDMRHIWDIYGTYMGHTILYYRFPISQTKLSYYGAHPQQRL
jgi:hypothetical protein